jgi:DNA-directed RNA polymerase subunit RPC12/RpoP
MKKTKCSAFFWNFGSIFLGFFGLIQLLGMPIWNKYRGWQDPSLLSAFMFIGTAIAMRVIYKRYCNEAKIVKCTQCGEVFSEIDTQHNDCPHCGGKLMDINKFNYKSNKPEEPIKNPPAGS